MESGKQWLERIKMAGSGLWFVGVETATMGFNKQAGERGLGAQWSRCYSLETSKRRTANTNKRGMTDGS